MNMHAFIFGQVYLKIQLCQTFLKILYGVLLCKTLLMYYSCVIIIGGSKHKPLTTGFLSNYEKSKKYVCMNVCVPVIVPCMQLVAISFIIVYDILLNCIRKVYVVLFQKSMKQHIS